MVAESRKAWEANAAYWDENFGEGNIYSEQLIVPATERLLAPRSGEFVLDVACGNGAFARRMAELGARVLAIDFTPEMVERARERTRTDRIEYRLVDATDEAALLSLGRGRFDAVVCTMAIMDMAAIAPLARAVSGLLRRPGRFVFSLLHPCFNNTSTQRFIEDDTTTGGGERRRGVKLSRYLTPGSRPGNFMSGQPEPHLYFERPLHELLGTFFAAGLVMDGIGEPAFRPPAPEASGPLSWKRMHEIPPILVVRLRPA